MSATETDQKLDIDWAWHRHFYEQARHGLVFWRGVQLVKNPMDLIVFAEIIHEVMPRVVVETGTRTGGSALFFADMMTIAGVPNPRVVSVDIGRDENLCPPDPRITYLTGSSVNLDILDEVHRLVQGRYPRLVTLDSDHHQDHVYAELEAYSYLVGPGSYLIVEDTNFGNPVDIVEPHLHDLGPAAGLAKWLPDHPEFVVDKWRDRFGVSFNVGAWLRRT
jgi:cephalosporin hydroxylase